MFTNSQFIRSIWMLAVYVWLTSSGMLLAQDIWAPTGGPEGGNVYAVYRTPTDVLFAGSDGGAVFRSVDNGEHWQDISIPLTNVQVQAVAVTGNQVILAGTNGRGVFRSLDQGENWSEANSGLGSLAVYALHVTGSDSVYAGTDDGLFITTTDGAFWTAAGLSGMRIHSMTETSNGYLFAATEADGMFRSTDRGLSWHAVNTGLTDLQIMDIASNAFNQLFAASGSSGVFRSFDLGNSWVQVNSGLTNLFTRSIAVGSNNRLYLGTYFFGEIFCSTNNGSTWFLCSNGLPGGTVHALAVTSSGNVFAGLARRGIYRSTNNGLNWQEKNDGFHATEVRDLVNSPAGDLFAATLGSGVFRSSDFGNSWLPVNNGLNNPLVTAIARQSNGYLYAGTFFFSSGIYRSTDNGNSWQHLPNSQFAQTIHAIYVAPNNDLFAASNAGIYYSNNNGNTWQARNNGITRLNVVAFAAKGDTLFAGTTFFGDGVFRSTDYGMSWQPVNQGLQDLNVNALAVNDSGHIFAGTASRGVARSTDNGDSWTPVNAGMENIGVYSLFIDPDGTIYAGTISDGIYISTDNGNTWALFNSGLTPGGIRAFELDNLGHLVAGTVGGGVYRTVDSVVVVPPVAPLLASPPNGATNQPISLSLTWHPASGADTYHVQVATDAGFTNLVVNDSLIADTSHAVGPLANSTTYYWRVRSRNAAGVSGWSSVWSFTTIVELPAAVVLLQPSNGSIIQADSVECRWRQAQPEIIRYWFEFATDSLFQNSQVDTGLAAADTVKLLRNLAFNQTYWWRVRAKNAAGWGPFSEVWNFRTEEPVGIAGQEDIPKAFALHQNYPNPFNPTTTIAFDLPRTSRVTLQIIDITGRRVRTLVDGQMPAGRHRVVWDGRGEAGQAVASGVYLYRLQAGDFVSTRKMVLMR